MLRRDFFKRAGQSMGALWALQSAAGAKESAPMLDLPADGYIDARDEKLWAEVRKSFPLTRRRTYLNTGGLGASPQIAIDAMQAKTNELEEISEVGHSHELWAQIKEKAGRVLGCAGEEVGLYAQHDGGSQYRLQWPQAQARRRGYNDHPRTRRQYRHLAGAPKARRHNREDL